MTDGSHRPHHEEPPPTERSLGADRIAALAAAVDPDFGRRIGFVLELDRLKHVVRRNHVADGSRRENTAEHSWHLAMLAIALAPHAPDGVDLAQAIEMLLVHDIVEIDAGDTFAYDEAGHADKAERELRAADRLYGLLPPGQGAALRATWDEYEAAQTPTAVFAHACDHLAPLLLNAASDGRTWRAHDLQASQVLARNRSLAATSPLFWELVERVVAEAVEHDRLGPS